MSEFSLIFELETFKRKAESTRTGPTAVHCISFTWSLLWFWSLRLFIPSDHFRSGIPTNILYVSLNLYVHDSFSLCSFLQPFTTSSSFDANTGCFIMFSVITNIYNKETKGPALTLRSLTLYIYGAPILDVSRSHTTTQHSP